MHRAYLGLGSNLEPARYLPAAVSALQGIGQVVAVSQVYESAAVGAGSQPNYLNAAVVLHTLLAIEELANCLSSLESRLGRVRDPRDKYAARTIDLDLVLYDDVVLTVGRRRIPDPEIMTRPFLAVPLAEVDGDYIHPEAGETLSEIAARVRSHGPTIFLRSDVILQ